MDNTLVFESDYGPVILERKRKFKDAPRKHEFKLPRGMPSEAFRQIKSDHKQEIKTFLKS